MLTRCPHCHTTFRVTSEQLKVRQGRVRCGACSEVFDALESLADEVSLIVAPAAGNPAPGAVAEDETPVSPESAAPPDPAAMSAGDLKTGPGSEPESRAPQDGEKLVKAPPAAAVPDVETLPEAWEGVAETPPPRRWPWAIGLLVLLALAAGQLAYIYRVELAVLAPELRPTLVAACEVAGCSVPWPRRPELVGIESSDLEPAGGDRLLLTATLKNRAPFVQEYPHLELTLTDTQDDALLRKVLPPVDWLPAGQSAADGFAARGELAVKLLLEAQGVPAVGYRLYLFYP